VGLTSC